jgi:RNA polymerase sigma-54 factor
MKQGLSLRVSQQLTLTPALQQSIRLLQLSTLELSAEVEEMLDENPFLERAEETAERESFGVDQADAPVSAGDTLTEQADGFDGLERTEAVASDVPDAADSAPETDWDGDGTVEIAPNDSEWGSDAPPTKTSSGSGDGESAAQDLASAPVSLTDHLHQQAIGLRLTPVEKAALEMLIESLDEDGYLADSLADLARGLAGDDWAAYDDLMVVFQDALEHLQAMDPVGVGAADLAECLRLQIEAMRNTPVAQAALRICEQPLELLAKRDVKRLIQNCDLDDAVAREAIALIQRLEPKPGRRFIETDRNIVIPDVIVSKAGEGFKVALNPAVMPRLQVHEIYAGAVKGAKGEAGAGLQQRLQEARWFIKNIQQRFDTILRVSSAIVERQNQFFAHGELAMKPLVLREIAEELGLHESTISRVTTAKYMATPHGTFELKYFFGSGLGTESGNNASSTAVRALIKQFIAAETPKKPLSDNQLSELLRDNGIECARRTVAKYREAMRIAPANLRKEL